MIARNMPINAQVRRRRTHAQAQAAHAVQTAAQNTLNAVLWQIIMHSARTDAEAKGEDFDGKDGVITVELKDVEQVPKGFALTIDIDPDTNAISIKAVVQKPKSKIVLADGSRLNG